MSGSSVRNASDILMQIERNQQWQRSLQSTAAPSSSLSVGGGKRKIISNISDEYNSNRNGRGTDTDCTSSAVDIYSRRRQRSYIGSDSTGNLGDDKVVTTGSNGSNSSRIRSNNGDNDNNVFVYSTNCPDDNRRTSRYPAVIDTVDSDTLLSRTSLYPNSRNSASMEMIGTGETNNVGLAMTAVGNGDVKRTRRFLGIKDATNSGSSTSTIVGADDAANYPSSESLGSVIRGVVELRSRVSLSEHLQRLLFVLTWSDCHGGGRWMGIKNFIDCYFSTVFHPYFGDAFRMNILHVAKSKRICATFSPGVDERSYTILVMLNYPLWNKLLQVAVALPDRYFRHSPRSRLATLLSRNSAANNNRYCNRVNGNGGGGGSDGSDSSGITSTAGYLCRDMDDIEDTDDLRIEENTHHCGSTMSNNYAATVVVNDVAVVQNATVATLSPASAGATVASTSFRPPSSTSSVASLGGLLTTKPLFQISLAALCLVDRLEYSMLHDLEHSHAAHVVTLARFFANSQDAQQLLHNVLSYE